MLLGILKQLGVDRSVFYQFAIFISMFFILNHLLFKKLLSIFQERINKTIVLEQNAHQCQKEVQALEKKYDELIEDNKVKIIKSQDQKLRSISDSYLIKIVDEKRRLSEELSKEMEKVEKEAEDAHQYLNRSIPDFSEMLIKKIQSEKNVE